MVGVEPETDCGRLYESLLALHESELSKVKPRTLLVNEPMPWRPPISSVGSETPRSATDGLVVVTVPDHSTDAAGVTHYRILTELGLERFESVHRFSEFQSLLDHLRQRLRLRPALHFPPAVRFPGKSGPLFLGERRGALQHFLQCVADQYPTTLSDPNVAAFLGIPTWLLTPTTEPVHPAGLSTGMTVSVPFFSYYPSPDQDPVVQFCLRMTTPDNQWVRFHSLEDFHQLKTNLNIHHEYLLEALDLPRGPAGSNHFEIESKTVRIQTWIQNVIDRVGRQDTNEFLSKFIHSSGR